MLKIVPGTDVLVSYEQEVGTCSAAGESERAVLRFSQFQPAALKERRLLRHGPVPHREPAQEEVSLPAGSTHAR